jgi:hypothetical protein
MTAKEIKYGAKAREKMEVHLEEQYILGQGYYNNH